MLHQIYVKPNTVRLILCYFYIKVPECDNFRRNEMRNIVGYVLSNQVFCVQGRNSEVLSSGWFYGGASKIKMNNHVNNRLVQCWGKQHDHGNMGRSTVQTIIIPNNICSYSSPDRLAGQKSGQVEIILIHKQFD